MTPHYVIQDACRKFVTPETLKRSRDVTGTREEDNRSPMHLNLSNVFSGMDV
jgi:hypothetical protein